MDRPELWVVTGKPGEQGLRFVPFDEAAERMIFPWLTYGPSPLTVAELRKRMRCLLHAAVWEGEI